MFDAGASIDKTAFLSRELNAHQFFEDLPSDGFRISGVVTDEKFLTPIVNELLNADFEAINERALDTLLLVLANEFFVIQPNEQLRWLADHLSLAYAWYLKGKRNRALRMKLQKCNFYLRDLLDRDVAPEFLEEKCLGVTSPWDWLVIPQGEMLITSDQENVHIKQADKTYKRRCGLPSQIDCLSDGRISVGSIFSNGGYLMEENSFRFLDHDLPIVLFFIHDHELLFLDYYGHIFREHDRECLATLDLWEVSRVRNIKGHLYVFDWTAPHSILIFNPDTNTAQKVRLKEILLGNDICMIHNCFYLLDKQQGSIFKFDSNFRFLERRLSFGKHPGRLYDPIALRFHQGKIFVLNWLSRKMVSVKFF